MPVVTILCDPHKEHNNPCVTVHEQIANVPLATDELDDHDLAELLYACTAGGELGRAATAYYNRYIAQGYEYSEQALRVLASMEARQRGGRR